MLEYSDNMMIAPPSWPNNFFAERQNSSRVPSPGSASPGLSPLGVDLTWPSFYGNQPSTDLNKDAFLGQYIHRIYCRECREQEAMAAANQQAASSSSGSQPNSPPQYQMDQMSLATAMDANKEALTRRLMLRRSVNELVDAGIYPSLKAPTAFAEQRIQLERAKTGDILKHKIEQRPGRQFLVQHHILQDSNVDPSLAIMQQRLKKAKLTDELNEKIANRPGPLELVEQSILEADDPLKTALKDGTLEFHKTEQGTDPNTIEKLPYVIDSPKSGHSSPEPTDCDNDSNASSTLSTGFQPTAQVQVPSPPDIAPLITATQTHTSVTIGGKTLKIPLSTQSFAPQQITTFTVAPQAFTTSIQRQPSSFGASRNHRRAAKSNRPSKAQFKPKVIKFHEYKGPPTTKSNNTSAGGQFVTTTGPIQRLEGLTPYQVRVQQQQLYLQCQLEIQSNDSTGSGPSAAVLVPIQAPPTPMIPIPSPSPSIMSERQEISPPRQPDSAHSSRPATPGLSMKSPSMPIINTQHKTVQLTRSLSQLEDLKVADLRQELKQRSLLVSGTKSQLIERLRNHHHQFQQEMSVNIPSVSSGSGSEYNYSTGIPSVQSFTEDTMMAPPSVASVMSNRVHSPPPCSPKDDIMRSPPPVFSQISMTGAMETDDPSVKSTADIVREQAKQIEDLQRKLNQLQQQFPTPSPISMSAAPNGAIKTESVSQPTSPRHIQLTQQQIQHTLNKPTQQVHQKLPQHIQQQLQLQLQTQSPQTPVDITDKQVYLATPDGKMTAYKVILHTGSGVVQHQPMSKAEIPSKITQPRMSISAGDISPQPLSSQQDLQTMIRIPGTSSGVNIAQNKIQLPTTVMTSAEGTTNRQSQGINVDDVLEVLIRTGEMDPAMINGQTPNSLYDAKATVEPQGYDDQIVFSSPREHRLGTNNQTELEAPLSPLPNMDWMDTDPSDSLDLEGLDEDPQPPLDNHDNFVFNDESGSLDWLSDVMQLDSDPTPNIQQPHFNNLRECDASTSDPILTPRPQDVMSIFHMEDSEFRPEPVSSLYWDKLASQHL